jgi:hypothetical protein
MLAKGPGETKRVAKLKSTKTKAGERWLPLPPPVALLLEKWKLLCPRSPLVAVRWKPYQTRVCVIVST